MAVLQVILKGDSVLTYILKARVVVIPCPTCSKCPIALRKSKEI